MSKRRVIKKKLENYSPEDFNIGERVVIYHMRSRNPRIIRGRVANIEQETKWGLGLRLEDIDGRVYVASQKDFGKKRVGERELQKPRYPEQRQPRSFTYSNILRAETYIQ
tara:strand:- start:743 stop:1072 length:330 start_codon:yes stop_codon:yes gene_type:complete